MKIDIYVHERCGHCGDILHSLQNKNIEYQGHHFPPKKTDIEALKNGISEPVLIHKERAPDGIVGHDEILEWIEDEY